MRTNLLKHGFSLLVFLFIGISAKAQPRITSISPISGKPGDTIVIVGTNFAGTVALTDVFFGNAKVNTYRSASSTTLRVIVPVGATYAPIIVQDKLNNRYGTSRQFFSPTFTKPKGSFDANDMTVSNKFSTGTNPYNVAVGDIDGDGKPDAVVVNYGANTFSVLRNTSTIGNVGFATKVDFGTALNPYSVAVADINNDSKLDVVVVNNGSSSITVYQNTSSIGTISFAATSVFATGLSGSGSTGIAVADIDSDGWQDVLVCNGGNNKVSYLQNISTTSTIGFAAKIEYTTGTTPRGIAIGDIDGDNKLDIVTANAGAGSISVIRNTMTISGSLTLATKVDYSVGLDPTSVALGDINADGKLDVIVSNYNATNISTLRNTSVSGSITLAAAVNKSSVSFPETVAITDIDSDGKLDIMYANNASSFSVLKNTTTVATSPTYTNSIDFTTGSLTKAHAMGDIDGDGKIDAVVITNFNNAIVVVRNTPQYSTNANLSAFIINTTPYTPVLSTSVTNYTATVTNATTSVTVKATKAQDSATLQIQLNGGTYTALTSGVNSSALPLNLGENVINIKVTAQDGTTIKIYTFTVTRIAPPTITSISPVSGTVGTSVMLTGTFYSSTPSNNVVFFGATQANVTAATTTSLTVAVPAGATYAPITVLNTLSGLSGAGKDYFNTTFKPNKGSIDTMDMTASNAFATNSAPYSVAIGDIDGDGKADEVVADYSNAKFSVYRNTSTSGNVNFASKVDFTTLANAQSVTLGDINNDGKLDVIVVHFMDSISIFRNTSTSGNITFAPRVNVLAGLAISVFSKCVVGDINNDGKNDIILNNTGQYQINVLRNTSTSTTNISFAFFSTFPTGNNPTSIAIGDIDNDGKADIITANANPANPTGTAFYVVSVLKNISTTTTVAFATKSDFTVDGKPSYVALADINGDGTNDIVTGNSSTNNVSVLINYSTPGVLAFSTTNNFSTGVNANSLGIADIDGDGKLDIAVSSVKTGIRVLRNTSTSTSINNLSFAAPVSIGTAYVYEDIATGDIDGDGKTDISAIGYFAPVLVVLRNTPILSGDNNLTTMSASAGALVPVFDSLTLNYNINVHNYVTTTTVTATKHQDSAKIEMQFNGAGYTAFTSGSTSSILSLNIGVNTINFKVTAQNGNVKIYTLTITRACLAPSSTTNLSVCPSQLPYSWNGLTFTVAGSKSTILTTSLGCDSSVTLNLTLKLTSSSLTSITICDSLNWNGTWYKQSGLYTYHTSNSVGCDSAARVNLTIKKSTTSWTDVLTCDSTFWNGKWYSKSGFYTIHLTNKAGCDSAASLNLTVNDKPNGVFSSAVYGNLCAPDSVLIFFDVLGRSKQYLKIISPIDTSFEIGIANFGADIKTIPLSGNGFVYLPNSSTNNQACSTTFATGLFSGKVVIIDRGTCTFAAKAKAVQDAGAAGIIIVNNVTGASAMSMSGVDATITIPVISVSQADGQIIKNWISANQFTNGYTVTHTPTYLWSNGKTTASVKVTPTQTTTYSVNVSYENGCSQIFYYAVVIPKTSTSSTTLNACDSLVWNGVTYKTSGIYTFKTTNSEGCDSTATLNLTVTKTPNAGTISGANSFCFIGGSTTLTSNGDAGGVWSSNNSNRVSVNSAGKVTASTGGNYIIYYTVTNSCGSSTASFNIKVNVPSQSVLSVTACGSYTWNGTTYTKTGLYSKTGMTTVGGCDSTASLDLTINPLPIISNVTANPSTICAGNSSVLTVTGNGGLVTTGTPTDYWFNSPITFNNTSNQMLPNAVEYTKINVTTASTINSLWVELWQNAPSGITCKMAIYTNDATTGKPQTLIQETDPVISNTVSKLISGRNQFALNPTLILQPGTYWVAAIWQSGNLPIKQFTGSTATSYYTLRNYSLGFPTSLTSGQTTSEGFVVGIGLRATAMTDAAASYTWFPSSTLSSSTGVSVTATPTNTRTYIVNASNAFNCTTNSTVSVTVKSTSTSTTNLSVCDSVIWNNVTYKQSGVYTYKTINAVGCDSTATLNLIVKKSTTSTTNLSVCDSVIWNNISYKQSGVYTYKTQNAVGCDSSATLNLTVKTSTSSTSNLSICPSQLPYSWNGITFTAAGSQTKTGLVNSQGCDSSATLNLSVKTSTSSTSNLSICPSQIPYSWNGLTFTAAGSQTKTGLVNSQGCDSSATLNLTVKTNTSSTNDVSICPSQLPYSWNGLTFTTAGSQTKTGLVNSQGCDSSATLNLSIKTSTSSTSNLSICPSQLPYSWNGLSFTTAGSQTKTGLVNSQGCDSSAKLNLSVKTSTSSTSNLSICPSQLPYSWNGLTFTAAGSQTKTGLLNSQGCDSSATLNLTVNAVTYDTILKTICSGQTYLGHFNTGIYTDTLINSTGCDSIRTLNLVVTQSVTPTISIATASTNVCKGYVVEYNAAVLNEGINPIIQWYKNGIVVGTNSSVYKDSLLNNQDNIWCVLTSSEDCVTANNIKSNLITMNVSLAITGSIKTPNGSLISNVLLYRTGAINDTQIVSKKYNSSCINSNNTINLRSYKNNDITKTNGINATDILLTQRHILNITKLNSAYKIIAADVNGDKNVNATDVLRIKRLILGMDTTFTSATKGNRLWEFVDSAYTFPDATNPFPFKDSISFTNLTSNKINQTFIGVKLGDVNYDWSPLVAKSSLIDNVELIVDNADIKVDKQLSTVNYQLPIKVKNFKDLVAMQYTLHFNNKAYELVAIENNHLNIDFNSKQASENGNITMLWTDKNAVEKTFEDGTKLFTLVLRSTVNNRLSTDLKLALTNDITEVAAWDKDLNQHNIILTKRATKNEQPETRNDIVIYPNPATDIVNIDCSNAKQIVIVDAMGRTVHQSTVDSRLTTVNTKQFSKGVYFVQVTFENGTIKNSKLVIE